MLYAVLFAAMAALLPSAESKAAELSFDVASVKPDKSDLPPYSNFPLNSGDMYVANGGLFSASNFPLITYIFFAYKLQGNQGEALIKQMPGWAMNERFDIEARAAGNPTKDQMRTMMRSLLADRFHLAIHTETREVPVLAFVLVKPDRTGPQLQQHSAGAPCAANPEPPSSGTSIPKTFSEVVAGGFPALCNNILGLSSNVSIRARLAGRNVTLAYMTDMFSQRLQRDRPMIDATGLSGTFDFLLEFKFESNGPAPDLNAAGDPDGLTFEQALRDQLGLKMESRRSSMSFIVLDHVDRPSQN